MTVSSRVDQVGSLLRSQALREAWARAQSGQLSADELRGAQDEAIRAVIYKQEALGLPVATDGEFRRTNFQDGFAQSVAGFEKNPSVVEPPPGFRPGAFGRTSGRLSLVRNPALEEWRFSQPLTQRTVKITVVSPAQIALRVQHDHADSGYENRADFLADAARIQGQVLRELCDAGCRYVQVDAPSYSEYVDQARVDQARRLGEDVDARLREDLDAENAVIAGLSGGGYVLAIHICRGNFPLGSPLLRSGGYEAIAEMAFSTLQHDRFLLEYDSERSGGFEPLRFVPGGKTVVLGLVTTKAGELEDEDTLKRRIDEAARYLPLEQLAISPQCGFATAVTRSPGRMSEDDQWRKLELVRRVARDVWTAG